ncbi:hypothetical protein BCR33DRAFT_711756, partial [Rhizoclosmatium globosum]
MKKAVTEGLEELSPGFASNNMPGDRKRCPLCAPGRRLYRTIESTSVFRQLAGSGVVLGLEKSHV